MARDRVSLRRQRRPWNTEKTMLQDSSSAIQKDRDSAKRRDAFVVVSSETSSSSLEVLRDAARVALLRPDAGALELGLPSGADIADDRLIVVISLAGAVGCILRVVGVIVVVICASSIIRALSVSSGRVGGGGIRGAPGHATCTSSARSGTNRGTFRGVVAVYKWLARVATFRIGVSVRRRSWAGLSAVIRIRHADAAVSARKVGGSFASGGRASCGGRSTAPAAISTSILAHLRRRVGTSTHRGQGRVMIGIVAVLFDLLPSLLLESLVLLVAPPEEDEGSDDQRHTHDGDDDRNGDGTTRTQATGAARRAAAAVLQLVRAGSSARGCS